MRRDIPRLLPRFDPGGGLLRSLARVFLAVPMAALMACNTRPGAAVAGAFTYTCADGSEVRVAHSSVATAASVTLTLDADSAVPEQVRAASGAKYSNGSLTGWEKGESGMVPRDDEVVRRDYRKT